jgi:tetratricopeptide (TPR) repeat protein
MDQPPWRQTMTRFRTIALLAGAAFALAVAAPDQARAVYSNDPAPNPPQQTSGEKASKKSSKKKKAPKQGQKSSEQKFIKGYQAAVVTIYQRHDYVAGIAALKALGYDDNPDVANLIGYSSRKLGRYDDAKTWYERALAADPKHARTWSYYGMWHAEQGNVLKARDYLATVESLCGTTCREYAELKGVIEGTRVY